jgi:hypothetical protein
MMMVVRAVVSCVFMIMGLRITSVRMLVRVLVLVRVAMRMRVLVAVLHAPM